MHALTLKAGVLLSAFSLGLVSCQETAPDMINSPEECIERGGVPTFIDIPNDGQGAVGGCKGAGPP